MSLDISVVENTLNTYCKFMGFPRLAPAKVHSPDTELVGLFIYRIEDERELYQIRARCKGDTGHHPPFGDKYYTLRGLWRMLSFAMDSERLRRDPHTHFGGLTSEPA